MGHKDMLIDQGGGGEEEEVDQPAFEWEKMRISGCLNCEIRLATIALVLPCDFFPLLLSSFSLLILSPIFTFLLYRAAS